MPRNQISIEQNVKAIGIFTEGNPLAFPEGASLDETNFVINKDGSRDRRLGLELEIESGSTVGYASTTYSPHLAVCDWSGAGNVSTNKFVAVCYKGYGVSVFDTTTNPFTLKATYNFPFNLEYSGVSMCVVDTKLFIANGYYLGYLQYVGTSSLQWTSVDPNVRDIWGVADSGSTTIYAPNYRPSSLTAGHYYNLQNQGWFKRPKYWPSTTTSHIELAKSDEGVYPSNADNWIDGKTVTGGGSDVWRMGALIAGETSGTSLASKGHFVVAWNNLGSSRYLQSVGLVDTAELGGYDDGIGTATVVAAFAGRVWYAGFAGYSGSTYPTTPARQTTILFSQVGSSREKYKACHTKNDPTAEEINDVLASDGGTITINELGTCIAMVPFGSSLLVFGTNGVWAVGSTDGGVFSATAYSVTKVSDVAVYNKNSIVVTANEVFVWAENAIYAIRTTETGGIVGQNITADTIQTLYSSIPSDGKLTSFGTFDKLDNKVKWLYADYQTYTIDNNYIFRHNKELILDLSTGAWSKNEFPVNNTHCIAAYIPTTYYIDNDVVTEVMIGAYTVEVGVDPVVTTRRVRDRGTPSSHYLVLHVPSGTNGSAFYVKFARASNVDFLDWGTTDAQATLITGYSTAGDTAREKQIEYLTVHCLRTETGIEDAGGGDYVPVNPSSCKIRTRWGWSNSASGGKWGSEFEAYRHRRMYMPLDLTDTWDDGYSIVTTKNRVRGSGKSFNFEIKTQPGYDLSLLGWAVELSGNGSV